jgi:capsid protein
MALEEFKARIALMLDTMSARPEDAHEIQERIREQLAEMRAMGLPLPEDLVALERSLSRTFEEDTHARPRGHTDPRRS